MMAIPYSGHFSHQPFQNIVETLYRSEHTAKQGILDTHHLKVFTVFTDGSLKTKQRKAGRTGHTEVVRVIYDPDKVSYETLLKAFWESHDPTQGMRQGGDVGTQYRSAIYISTDAQHKAAEASKRSYQEALTNAHRAAITTEIRDAPEFFYAEEYHQQYLAKNPAGYCGLGGCGVAYKA
jgi:methionine-S-sulfoxide reductase